MENVQIFKNIVEQLYSSIPNEKKLEMYEQHKLEVDIKNKFKKSLIHSKDEDTTNDILDKSILLNKKKKILNKNYKSKDAYSMKYMPIIDYIKCKIVLMLLDSKYSYLVSGGLTLDEIGYLFDFSRERIRQVENNGLRIFKNIKLLKAMNLNKEIDDIVDSLYRSVKEKNAKKSVNLAIQGGY